jgi:hypothetical protein
LPPECLLDFVEFQGIRESHLVHFVGVFRGMHTGICENSEWTDIDRVRRISRRERVGIAIVKCIRVPVHEQFRLLTQVRIDDFRLLRESWRSTSNYQKGCCWFAPHLSSPFGLGH